MVGGGELSLVVGEVVSRRVLLDDGFVRVGGIEGWGLEGSGRVVV